MAKSKAKSFKGFPAAKRKQLEQLDQEVLEEVKKGAKKLLPGQGGTELEEPMVTYEPTQVEVVLPRKASHWGRHRIVFGRDRHTREGLSGYGGRGCTAAGSIDIVVGSGGPEPTHGEIVGPNFYTDAARIYLTQRGDIDAYFTLPTDVTNGVLPAENRSAIGIKADGIRIIGREGVRLYTNARTKQSGRPPEGNAQGGDVQSRNGIHLVANMDLGPVQLALTPDVEAVSISQLKTYNKLQPMVMGDFLVEFLNDLMRDIKHLQEAVEAFSLYQIEFNTAIAAHTHPVVGATPGVAVPDLVSLIPQSLKANIGTAKDTLIKTAIKQVEMGIKTKQNWLKPSSPLYILSNYNKTN